LIPFYVISLFREAAFFVFFLFTQNTKYAASYSYNYNVIIIITINRTQNTQNPYSTSSKAIGWQTSAKNIEDFDYNLYNSFVILQPVCCHHKYKPYIMRGNFTHFWHSLLLLTLVNGAKLLFCLGGMEENRLEREVAIVSSRRERWHV